MKRPKKRGIRRNAAAKSLAEARFRQRIVKNPKTYTRKGRRPTDSGLSDSRVVIVSRFGAGPVGILLLCPSRACVGPLLGRAAPEA